MERNCSAAEEDDVEVPTAGGDVDEGVSESALASGRRVLIELVDEDHHRVHAEFLIFGHSPDFGDHLRDQDLLHVGVAVSDVDDAQLLIAEGSSTVGRPPYSTMLRDSNPPNLSCRLLKRLRALAIVAL